MSLRGNIIVSKNILETFKCARCSLYLSVAPIMYDDNQNLICGRCFNEKCDLHNRASAIEAIATFLPFPCRYSNEGCKEQELKWDSVMNHEISCEYQCYVCPVVPLQNCSWKGTSAMLLRHFNEIHPRLVLDGDHLPISLTKYANEIYMVSQDNLVFLVRYAVQVSKGEFWFELCYAGMEPDEKFCYKLDLINAKDGKKIVFKNNPIFFYWAWSKRKAICSIITSIEQILKTSNILCKITVFKESNLEVISKNNVLKHEISRSELLTANKDVLSELECPVCMDYLEPPIFVCQNGHSVCGNCKEKLSNCSVCRVTLGNTRNFILEKLIDHIMYPCKNKDTGCKFTGNFTTICNHHKNCSTGVVDCPLKESENCDCKVKPHDRLKHLFAKHPHAFMSLRKKIHKRNLYLPAPPSFHILNLDNQLLKICCKHSISEASISWSFQHIGLQSREISPYKLAIVFVDQSGHARQFVIDVLCRSSVSDREVFKDALRIPYSLLEPFIDDDYKVVFIYDVLKANET